MVRPDTFRDVRQHLADLSDAELEALFWQLSAECVDPLVKLARTHTSPSIERSVLMRMGLDSLTSQGIVAECVTRGFLGHGAGHVVLICMQTWDCDAISAAARLVSGEGWEIAEAKWGSGE